MCVGHSWWNAQHSRLAAFFNSMGQAGLMAQNVEAPSTNSWEQMRQLETKNRIVAPVAAPRCHGVD